MRLNIEKLAIIKDAIANNKTDAWLITGRETIMKSEPALEILGDIDFIIASCLIFTKEKTIAIVSPLDVEGYKRIEGIDEVYCYEGTMEDTILDVIEKYQFKTLALNYSESDSSGDGLTFGMYLKLQDVFNKLSYKMEIVSAYPIISKVRGIKTASQLAIIEDCAIQADKYLRSIPSMCTKDTTSLDIFNYLQKVAADDGYTMSWAKDQCPGVSVDPNVPSGHMGLIETPIVKGNVINIDYGVRKDGYCSDFQRMYYVLKDDETCAPPEVVEAFNVVRDAIKKAADFMKPGVTGFEVDQVARHYIVDMGYDSWNAALGHQVGHKTHDGGTILANRRKRYNRPDLIDVPLDAGNVFTLEPSVKIPQGRVGLEEEVIVTETGARFIVEPQQEIMLIRVERDTDEKD